MEPSNFRVADHSLTGDLSTNHYTVRGHASSLRPRESESVGSGTRLWFGHADGGEQAAQTYSICC